MKICTTLSHTIVTWKSLDACFLILPTPKIHLNLIIVLHDVSFLSIHIVKRVTTSMTSSVTKHLYHVMFSFMKTISVLSTHQPSLQVLPILFDLPNEVPTNSSPSAEKSRCQSWRHYYTSYHPTIHLVHSTSCISARFPSWLGSPVSNQPIIIFSVGPFLRYSLPVMPFYPMLIFLTTIVPLLRLSLGTFEVVFERSKFSPNDRSVNTTFLLKKKDIWDNSAIFISLAHLLHKRHYIH